MEYRKNVGSSFQGNHFLNLHDALACVCEVESDCFCIAFFPSSLNLLSCLYLDLQVSSCLLFLFSPLSCWGWGVSKQLHVCLAAGWYQPLTPQSLYKLKIVLKTHLFICSFLLDCHLMGQWCHFRPLLATIIEYCVLYKANNKIHGTEPEQAIDFFHDSLTLHSPSVSQHVSCQELLKSIEIHYNLCFPVLVHFDYISCSRLLLGKICLNKQDTSRAKRWKEQSWEPWLHFLPL